MQVLCDLCIVSYWIDSLVLKTEGNTYATLLHHPFLFKGKPTHAQEVARRISGAVAREIYAQVKTYQVPITNSSPSHYIICHLPLIFLSPTSPLPFYSPFFLPALCVLILFCNLLPSCLKNGEVIIDKDNNMENFDVIDDPLVNPTILHTIKFWSGSGNIIGKGVIQDFFTCAGALPSNN